MSVTDLLSQAGSAIGTVGTALSGYLVKRVLKSAENADAALTAAKEARSLVVAATDALNTTFAATKAALRMEVDSFKDDVNSRLQRMSVSPDVGMRTPWPSRPDLGYDDRVGPLVARVETLSSQLTQTRERLKEIEGLFNDRNKEDLERWLKMERWMGQLETLTNNPPRRERS